jgi:hypothetical protein
MILKKEFIFKYNKKAVYIDIAFLSVINQSCVLKIHNIRKEYMKKVVLLDKIQLHQFSLIVH